MRLHRLGKLLNLSCLLSKYRLLFFLIFLIFGLNQQGWSQNDTTSHVSYKSVILLESSLYVGSMVTLGSVWYSKFDHTQWHWFDDSREWLQMDKAGHAFSTYQGARFAYEIHRYAGFTENQSLLWSSVASFVAVSTIEIFDGFAVEWGASASDLVANAFGVGLFAIQQKIVKNQPIKLKMSYHPTNLYKFRPELLGATAGERIVKDYNAQQYWLSVNLHHVIPFQCIPKWLNLAIGYGATNMISANTNNIINEELIPYRRFFISPDIDLENIKTRSKFLKGTLKVLNAIKVPLPALEFNKHQSKFWFAY
jgi:hypothetical protein